MYIYIYILCTKILLSKETIPNGNQSMDFPSKSINWFPYDTSPHWKLFQNKQ